MRPWRLSILFTSQRLCFAVPSITYNVILFQLGQFVIGAQGEWGPDVWINTDLLAVFAARAIPSYSYMSSYSRKQIAFMRTSTRSNKRRLCARIKFATYLGKAGNEFMCVYSDESQQRIAFRQYTYSYQNIQSTVILLSWDIAYYTSDQMIPH